MERDELLTRLLGQDPTAAQQLELARLWVEECQQWVALAELRCSRLIEALEGRDSIYTYPDELAILERPQEARRVLKLAEATLAHLGAPTCWERLIQDDA
jgi:hypothetical protein